MPAPKAWRQAADERQAAELDAAAAAAQEWSARLDSFCAELEREGFDVKRDGWSVTIEIRPRPRQ